MRMQRFVMGFVIALIAMTSPSGVVSAQFVEVGLDDHTVYGPGSGPIFDSGQTALAYDVINDQYMIVGETQEAAPSGSEVFAFAAITDPLSATSFVGNLADPIRYPRNPDVAFDLDSGNYLVVWSQDLDAPGAFEIYGRRVDRDGAVVGAAFRISDAGSDPTNPAYDALQPAVASDGHGNFYVTWAADDDRNIFEDGTFRIWLRRINANSGALGPRLAASGETGRDALAPDIVYLPWRDDFFLVYENDLDTADAYVPTLVYGTFPNGFAEQGTNETVVVTIEETRPKALPMMTRNPQMAVNPFRQQVCVVWDENPGTNASQTIIGQTFDSNIQMIGHVELNTGLVGNSCWVRNPAVAHSYSTDSFVVTWTGTIPGTPDCTGEQEVYFASIASANPTVASPPMQISNMGTPGSTLTEVCNPAVAATINGDGEAWVMWASDPAEDGRFIIYGQILEGQVATDTPAVARPTKLAMTASPNPFNPRTTIRFDLPRDGRARIVLYDVRGQRVKTIVDEIRPAGSYDLVWDGTDTNGRAVGSGVYFAMLEQGTKTRGMKLVLVK